MEQLSFFETDYLSKLEPLKHWKYNTEIVEYFLRYKINRRGQVYDFKTNRYNIILNNKKNSNNFYPTVHLTNDFGKQNTYQIHRLVACSFLENKDKLIYTQVNHIDKNKKNHHILNLEWNTPSQNMQHAGASKNKNQIEMF
jgi:hypothetical protein